MRSIPAVFLALFSSFATVPITLGDSFCTLGRLFLAQSNDAAIRTFELDSTGGASATTTGPIELDSSMIGIPNSRPGAVLEKTQNGMFVAIVSAGTSPTFEDGTVYFVRTGILPSGHGTEGGGNPVEKQVPTLVDNFFIPCSRPDHFSTHDEKFAVFCDGMLQDPSNVINSTIWVVDERRLGTQGSSPMIMNATLEGSHHGLVVPVDEGHTLTSVPTPERLAGGTGSFPDGFHVYDNDLNVVHSINEVQDPSKSCTGMHGEAILDNIFAFACDQDHGGILIVEYNDAETYTTRAIDYPAGYETHRTATLRGHVKSGAVVGTLVDRTAQSYHLIVAYPRRNLPVIPAPQVQALDALPCGFHLEQANGEFLLVWMPSGVLRIYAFQPEWMLVAELVVADRMTRCTGTVFTAGYGHAYIVQNGRLFDVDFTDLDNVLVLSQPIAYTVSSAIVAGVPESYQCNGPTLPTVTSRYTTSAWVMIRPKSSDQFVTASSEFSTELLRFRRDIGLAMNLPLNRIFVGSITEMTGQDLVLEVQFAAPGNGDSNRASAYQAAEQFQDLVRNTQSELYRADRWTNRMTGEVRNVSPPWNTAPTAPTPTSAPPPVPSSSTTTPSKSLGTGAVVGIVIGGTVAVVLVLGMLVKGSARKASEKEITSPVENAETV